MVQSTPSLITSGTLGLVGGCAVAVKWESSYGATVRVQYALGEALSGCLLRLREDPMLIIIEAGGVVTCMLVPRGMATSLGVVLELEPLSVEFPGNIVLLRERGRLLGGIPLALQHHLPPSLGPSS